MPYQQCRLMTYLEEVVQSLDKSVLNSYPSDEIWYTVREAHISAHKLYQVRSIMRSEPWIYNHYSWSPDTENNDIPTVLPRWRFIEPNFIVWLKWTWPATSIFGRTTGRVCVDEGAVWTAFLWKACNGIRVLVSNVSFCQYITRTFKPITDNRKIPHVTVGLRAC